VIPCLLSLFEGTATGSFDDKPFLLDLSVWSRFLVAVGIFVGMERYVENGILRLLYPLLNAPLLPSSSQPLAKTAVNTALRRLASGRTEAALALAALGCSVLAAGGLIEVAEAKWVFVEHEGSKSLSYALLWTSMVSSPIYYFLMFRWVWRIVILALLITDISRLDLRLVATHPDGFAGIAFLGELPNVYTPFVLALSFVIAGTVAELMIKETIQAVTYTSLMGIWLGFVHVLLALPNFAFNRKLEDLKEETLVVSRSIATRHELEAERAVLGRNGSGATPEEVAAFGGVPDAKLLFRAANDLKTLLYQRTALLPVSAAATVPLLLAGLIYFPFGELLQTLRKLLLF